MSAFGLVWPSNRRAGSVTGTNSVVWRCAHMGNFSPVDQDEFKKQKKMVEHKLVLFATVIALLAFNKVYTRTPKVEIHTRPKLCNFGPL